MPHYLIVGRDEWMDNGEYAVKEAKNSLSPEEAVKEVGMAGFQTIDVYPVQPDPDGEMMCFNKQGERK